LNDEGYVHFKVNHSINFKDPETQQHTNTIEGLWRHAKFSLPQYHRKKDFIGGYLAKHMFLKQNKNKNDALIEFFKLAGHLYNANVPINVEQNSSDTDDEETDEETDDNIVY